MSKQPPLYDWNFVSDWRERKYRRPPQRRAGSSRGRVILMVLVWLNAVIWVNVLRLAFG